jgi:hypothetical protein
VQIAPAGQAVLGGVTLGDSIISLNGQPMVLYDQVRKKKKNKNKTIT